MIYYARVKALTQEKLAERAAEVATEIERRGGFVINITLYADSASIGRNKAGAVFYRAPKELTDGKVNSNSNEVIF